MFQALTYLRYEDSKYIYQLVDSDFSTEVAVAVGVGVAVVVAVAVGVAKEYEKRNLNIPANLALYYRAQERWNYNLDYIVQQNFKWYPELSKEFYSKYLDDIKRYMMLL